MQELTEPVTLAGTLSEISNGGTTLKENELPKRKLGRTGEWVSCLGLGGSHIGKPKLTDKEAIDLIRSAINQGLTFMDNSWDYSDGQAEVRMGKALKDGYRQKAFLMTKFDGRTRKEAAKQIDESLRRLGTDHVDLLQFHEVIRFEDPDRFFADDGAAEALIAARTAGKTRFIGFTGHKDPKIHLYMLDLARENGFRFDTVQMPLNPMDSYFRSFERLILPELVKEDIGVLGMKSMGSGILLKSKTVSAEDCLRYALNLPTSCVITGIDSKKILDQAIRVGRTFKHMNPEEVAALRLLVAKDAEHGKFELFKTTAQFDSTAEHPEWLGEATEQEKQLAS